MIQPPIAEEARQINTLGWSDQQYWMFRRHANASSRPLWGRTLGGTPSSRRKLFPKNTFVELGSTAWWIVQHFHKVNSRVRRKDDMRRNCFFSCGRNWTMHGVLSLFIQCLSLQNIQEHHVCTSQKMVSSFSFITIPAVQTIVWNTPHYVATFE